MDFIRYTSSGRASRTHVQRYIHLPFPAMDIARCMLHAAPFRHRQAAPDPLLFDGRQVAGSPKRAAEGQQVELQGEVERKGADVERLRREWEQWRLREETAFAKRLREKVGLPGVVYVPRHSVLLASCLVWSSGTRGKSIQSTCLLYTSPSPRDGLLSRMPSSA